MDERVYNKVCRYRKCRKEFTATSSATCYCCDEHERLEGVERRKARSRHKRYYRKNRDQRLHDAKQRAEARSLYFGIKEPVDIAEKPWRCECCGEAFLVAQIQVHHIDGNVDNNTASNLIGLCPRCHRHVHTGFALPLSTLIWRVVDTVQDGKGNLTIHLTKRDEPLPEPIDAEPSMPLSSVNGDDQGIGEREATTDQH